MVTFGNKWYLLAINGNFWQQMVTFGNKWYLLATNGNFWQQMVTFGNKWWLLAINGNFGQQMVTNCAMCNSSVHNHYVRFVYAQFVCVQNVFRAKCLSTGDDSNIRQSRKNIIRSRQNFRQAFQTWNIRQIYKKSIIAKLCAIFGFEILCVKVWNWNK